jgi:uncharacterized integral membrane protein
LTGALQAAGGWLRKLVAAVILGLLAVLIVAFAVANRQIVTLSFDPFDPAQPAYSKSMWLFAPIIASLVIGVVIGGGASWLRHGRWRRTARRLERELGKLREELDSHKRGTSAPGIVPDATAPPERLQLKPPLR